MELSFLLSYALLWFLVIFQSLVLLGVARAVYQPRASGSLDPPIADTPVLRDGEDLAGELAPEFSAVDVFGENLIRSTYLGRQTVLLFVSPDCSSCATTLHELNALRVKTGDNVVVVCRSRSEPCYRLAQKYELSVPVVADEDRSISDLFRIVTAPTAVLVGPDGRIQSYGHPMRGEQLTGLIKASDIQSELQGVQ